MTKRTKQSEEQTRLSLKADGFDMPDPKELERMESVARRLKESSSGTPYEGRDMVAWRNYQGSRILAD